MSSRHTRRKLAKAKQAEKLIALARAERSRQIAETVRKNKSSPIERNYYPSSLMGRLAEFSHRAYVTRPSQAGKASTKVTGFWHPPKK